MRILLPWFVSAIRCLAWTWRIEEVSRGAHEPGNTNVVYAFLHGDLLPLSVAHRNEGVSALVSLSGDGDLAAGVLKRFGYRLLRGSSSRGGVAALRAAVERLEAGGAVALAVDGPRGPRGSVSPGVAWLAGYTKCSVRCVVVAAQHSIVLSTWDRFVIPLPFSRVRLFYADIPAGGVDAVDDAAISNQLLELSESCSEASRGRLSRALTTAEPSFGLLSRE